MIVNGKHYQTVWMDGKELFLIEQNQLPFHFKIFKSSDFKTTCHAIKTMITRGAGAIGATAGYAMAQAALEAPRNRYKGFIEQARKKIEATRPTAYDLFYAVNKVYQKAISSPGEALNEAKRLANENAEAGRHIGINGDKLIKDGMSIETHCNAGWLAFVDYGSALSPVYTAHRNGKNVFVFVDETRPRSQGSRLTAWELHNENVPHAIIPDNAGAYYMANGEIDMIIVGADRIAANGDIANKIGTLEKAIAAKHYNIPFYVAAPLSTIDCTIKKGTDITIEQRSEDEVHYVSGITEKGEMVNTRCTNPGSKALNPAFDVTPANLITGIITEKGIVGANKKAMNKLFDKPVV